MSRWWVVALALSWGGCAHVAKLRPTPKGQVALEAALGGPALKLGSIGAVAPMTSVGASYGLVERVDLSAHLHPTALVYSVVGLDVGASVLAVRENGSVPAVTFSGMLYGFAGLRGGVRPYFELSGAASWELNSRLSAYLSASALAQLSRWPAWSLGAGVEVRVGRGAVQLEGRWYDPSVASSVSTVDWVSPGHGAFGVVLGWHLNLGHQEAAP